MPFITRTQIDPLLRKKHVGSYRAELRRTLLKPGLSQAERLSIRDQLDNLEGTRIYRADSPSKPGAIPLVDSPRT